jgi:hypothetical protein
MQYDLLYSFPMARRPVENKKLPSEYPQFAFRLSQPKKDELSALVEKIQASRNQKRGDGEPFINKNDVIIEALEKGLKLLQGATARK